MSSPIEARDAATRLVGRITSGIAVASLAATGAIVGLLAPAATETVNAAGPVGQPSPATHPRRAVAGPGAVAKAKAASAPAAKAPADHAAAASAPRVLTTAAPRVAKTAAPRVASAPRRPVARPASQPPRRTAASPVASSGSSSP